MNKKKQLFVALLVLFIFILPFASAVSIQEFFLNIKNFITGRVTSNSIPTAVIGSPKNGEKFSEMRISFNGSSSSAENIPFESLMFKWEFDDGYIYSAKGSQGAEFTRLFSTSGPHRIKLTVDASEGGGGTNSTQIEFSIDGCQINVGGGEYEFSPFGTCSPKTNRYYCVNASSENFSGYYDTLVSHCEGSDSQAPTADDCCPADYYCPSVGAGCKERITCSDSDSGKNYFLKGAVIKGDGTKYEDYCDTSNSIVEYSCNGNTMITSGAQCPDGYSCSDGACVQQNNTACTDSDGGKNYYVMGTVTANGQSLSDHCNDAYSLTEKFCSGNEIAWETYKCLNGCQESKCVNESVNITAKCTDSDGGKNYYAKGTATANDQSLSDYCNDDGSLTEKFCERGIIKWEAYPCPYGCKEGVCLKETCENGRIETKKTNSVICHDECNTATANKDSNSCKPVCTDILIVYYRICVNGEWSEWSKTYPISTNSPQSGCFQSENLCCIGDICRKASIECSEGYTPLTEGCDENCSPKAKCAPWSSPEANKTRLGCKKTGNLCCLEDKCQVSFVNCEKGYSPIFKECDENCKPLAKCEKKEGNLTYSGECNGCVYKDKCLPFGIRTEGKYCSIKSELEKQKSKEESCDNNFECQSNVCVTEKCLSSSFIQMIMEWLKNFFEKK